MKECVETWNIFKGHDSPTRSTLMLFRQFLYVFSWTLQFAWAPPFLVFAALFLEVLFAPTFMVKGKLGLVWWNTRANASNWKNVTFKTMSEQIQCYAFACAMSCFFPFSSRYQCRTVHGPGAANSITGAKHQVEPLTEQKEANPCEQLTELQRSGGKTSS
jgi:hypothetical protein